MDNVSDEAMGAMLNDVPADQREAVRQKLARLRDRVADHERTKGDIDALVTSLAGPRKADRRQVEERVAAALGLPFKDIVACRGKAQVPKQAAAHSVPFDTGAPDVPAYEEQQGQAGYPEDNYPPPEAGP